MVAVISLLADVANGITAAAVGMSPEDISVNIAGIFTTNGYTTSAVVSRSCELNYTASIISVSLCCKFDSLICSRPN